MATRQVWSCDKCGEDSQKKYAIVPVCGFGANTSSYTKEFCSIVCLQDWICQYLA